MDPFRRLLVMAGLAGLVLASFVQAGPAAAVEWTLAAARATIRLTAAAATMS